MKEKFSKNIHRCGGKGKMKNNKRAGMCTYWNSDQISITNTHQWKNFFYSLVKKGETERLLGKREKRYKILFMLQICHFPVFSFFFFFQQRLLSFKYFLTFNNPPDPILV